MISGGSAGWSSESARLEEEEEEEEEDAWLLLWEPSNSIELDTK